MSVIINGFIKFLPVYRPYWDTPLSPDSADPVRSGAKVNQTCFFVIVALTRQSSIPILSKLFQPCLTFMIKAMPYNCRPTLWHACIRLRWKYLQRTNTLAYFARAWMKIKEVFLNNNDTWMPKSANNMKIFRDILTLPRKRVKNIQTSVSLHFHHSHLIRQFYGRKGRGTGEGEGMEIYRS